MNDPRPVILFDGDRSFCNAIAFRRLACVLAVAGLLCVSSAQGQVIREEGFPVKGGVAEESAWAPVVRECDPFTVPDEFGESCAPREKTPDPFGFGPEAEARPGEPSGPAWRTPPRLECPAAIFLEELETGQVECHAWDASGEEYLEYSWEPAGSTTRDYLDNPRLIPEDAPNPSVVAPEIPAYETLESFRSGETTFLYRYRLTATSRATGLSSWREVEVYVSGSRPSVYCPLEVAVEEGETVSLDCEGADPLSHRMDYDEDGASILWEWEGPVAIFLEELETGQVECHAWDASGEEHLEYSWEPVGSTTRDYLDNPRLIPEDSPTPSVVAPETPSYETLESFYSGETTFLYRYRLTATSRATGLSSWREVEVYVSGSGPSVYCPLEVSVEEGEAIALDCEGADPLSHRMDYDEDGASIEWLWRAFGARARRFWMRRTCRLRCLRLLRAARARSTIT